MSSANAIAGVLDGAKYTIWCMKEPEYGMQIMAMGGALCDEGGQEVLHHWNENSDAKTISLKYYCRPYDKWHFKYCHFCALDDHNNLHHAVPSLEDTWKTDR